MTTRLNKAVSAIAEEESQSLLSIPSVQRSPTTRASTKKKLLLLLLLR
jgi:hypothetical protein